MQRICRERHKSEGNHLGKRVQKRKGGSNTEPSGTEHLEVSRGTCTAHWKVPEKKTKTRSVQCYGSQRGECFQGTELMTELADAKNSEELRTENGHWLWSARAVCWQRAVEWAGNLGGRRHEAERRRGDNPEVILNTNIIFIHYSSASSFKPAKSYMLYLYRFIIGLSSIQTD